MSSINDILLSLSCKRDWIQDKDFLGPALAEKILNLKKLPTKGKLLSVPTSTNAVYFIDEYIIKIFAPQICGYQSYADLQREVFLLDLMEREDIRTPRLYTFGQLNQVHLFHFCILEKINVMPFCRYLKTCSRKDIINFGTHLRHALTVFQSLSIKKPELSKTPLQGNVNVFVHADLTAENILYDGKSFAVIDFEDWQYSCADAELPAIAFELIPEYSELLPGILNISSKELKDKVYNGIQSHENPSRFESKYAVWASIFFDH